MLFYSHIKREFTHSSWKRGQSYFREERVQAVKLEGDLVSGKVQGTDTSAYETAIVMQRGMIFNSKCSCPAHRLYETHCKHVAALAIWVVERGSLLRAGIVSNEHGMAPLENEVRLKSEAMGDVRLRKLLQLHPHLAYSRFAIRRDRLAATLLGRDPEGTPFEIPITVVEAAALAELADMGPAPEPKTDAVQATPVLFVKGIFQRAALGAVTVESAVRYRDPVTGTVQINTLTHLVKQPSPNLWKTTHGVLLQTPPPPTTDSSDSGNFILRLDTQKVFYQGEAGFGQLVKLLTHKLRDYIAFDPSVDLQIEEKPLKLTGLKVGKSDGKGRKLTYEFSAPGAAVTSDDLEELAKQGRLSGEYVWLGDRIWKFETSLTRIHRYSDRAGVGTPEAQAAEEEDDKKGPRTRGHGSLQDTEEYPLHPLTAYRLSLELGVENFQVDSDWHAFHEWKKTFERKKLPLRPKVAFGFDLRTYQKNGLSWIWSLYHRGLSALLADEMGLGKTHQVLAFLSTLYRRRKDKPAHPALVVAPTSVIAAWVQKLQKYETGLKWHVFHGSTRTLPKTGVDLVLTTYGILQREATLREREWHIVILDEAQAIKNATTISSRASRTLKSKFRIAMTGTPIENYSTDLWSLMEFLIPGYFGSLPRFKRLYGWGREAPPEVEANALKRLVSPFLLRRTKAQVLKELPPKTEEVLYCEMTVIQRKAYRAVLSSAEANKVRENLEGAGKIDYANVLALLTRLKQICDHPKLADLTAGRKGVRTINIEESGKWETLDELLTEALGSNLKIVIFTQYLGMMDLIGAYLKKRETGYTDLRGDTSDRAERLKRFAEDPDCRVFLCSLLAGGLGIDLTSASVCIHIDRWWNPARENQATDRLHRIGQTRGVQVFKLQIAGTVEDRIASIIQGKKELSGALIEESAVGLKAFSRKELLQLLSPESV